MGFFPHWDIPVAAQIAFQGTVDKTLAKKFTQPQIFAPRLLQRVPPNYLPGTTMLFGFSNLPKKSLMAKRSAIVGPIYDLGSVRL